jgi:hypothetical protein
VSYLTAFCNGQQMGFVTSIVAQGGWCAGSWVMCRVRGCCVVCWSEWVKDWNRVCSVAGTHRWGEWWCRWLLGVCCARGRSPTILVGEGRFRCEAAVHVRGVE